MFNKNVARPAERNFQENIIPQITGEFRGKNLMNSSYTGEALGRAGRNVQENLDALRSQTMYQGQQDINNRRVNEVNNTLNRQTFAMQQPQESKSVIDQIIGSLAPQAGAAVSDYISSLSKGGGKSPTGFNGAKGSGGSPNQQAQSVWNASYGV